jgi:hypothetical protein
MSLNWKMTKPTMENSGTEKNKLIIHTTIWMGLRRTAQQD